jgi:hypothetical protein
MLAITMHLKYGLIREVDCARSGLLRRRPHVVGKPYGWYLMRDGANVASKHRCKYEPTKLNHSR